MPPADAALGLYGVDVRHVRFDERNRLRHQILNRHQRCRQIGAENTVEARRKIGGRNRHRGDQFVHPLKLKCCEVKLVEPSQNAHQMLRRFDENFVIPNGRITRGEV